MVLTTITTVLAPSASAARARNSLTEAAPSVTSSSTGVYFGAYVKPSTGYSKSDVMGAIERRESYFGRKLDIDNQFYNWTDAWPANWRTAWDLQNGRIPMISWGRTYSKEITAGKYDAMIATRADQVKALGKTIFIRWAWEPMVTRWSKYAGTPSQYIAAWKHIHDIFAAHGATNARWIWCPTAESFRQGTAGTWYPGASYVDWIATDGYNWYPGKQVPSDTWRSFAQIFQAFYNWGASRGKPLMAAEYGCQEDTPGRKAQWVAGAAGALKKQFPLIKAVVYFDTSNRFDWHFDTSASAYQAFKTMAQDPYFNR